MKTHPQLLLCTFTKEVVQKHKVNIFFVGFAIGLQFFAIRYPQFQEPAQAIAEQVAQVIEVRNLIEKRTKNVPDSAPQ